MSAELNVLITGAGGAAAIALQQNLNTHTNLKLFMADMDLHSSGLYLVPAAQRLLLPAGNADDFSDQLLSICLACEIDVLIPTVDVELMPIARNRQQFEQQGIQVISSGLPALATCADKLNLMQFLEGKHPLADFCIYDGDTDVNALDYPLIIKPRVGSGSRGVKLAHTVTDLVGIPKDGSFLTQEYLPGTEYSVDVYVGAQQKVLASVVRERIKVDSGIAVISRTLHDEALSSQAVQVANLLDIRYVANIQFRLNSAGEPRLLEVNPRFPGTMPLTVAAGVDMPAICMAEAQQQALQSSYPYRPITMVRTWQELFLPASELKKTISW